MYQRTVLVVSIASWSFSACGVEANLSGTDSQDSANISRVSAPAHELAQLANYDPAAAEADLLDGLVAGELESDKRVASVWFRVERNATCNGGWPGSRTCKKTFTSPLDIRSGSVSIRITVNPEPGVSVQRYKAWQVDSRTVKYSATVSEGDVFNPGKHTSSFEIKWDGDRGPLGGWDYCVNEPGGKCAASEGDCDSNSQCQPGLACVNDVGEWFGFDPRVDVCLPSGG